jgi:hypothetical protein
VKPKVMLGKRWSCLPTLRKPDRRVGTPVPTKIIRHKKPPNPDELGGFVDVIGVIRYVRVDTKSACPPYRADGLYFSSKKLT